MPLCRTEVHLGPTNEQRLWNPSPTGISYLLPREGPAAPKGPPALTSHYGSPITVRQPVGRHDPPIEDRSK
jgi:hypothetical protein